MQGKWGNGADRKGMTVVAGVYGRARADEGEDTESKHWGRQPDTHMHTQMHADKEFN